MDEDDNGEYAIEWLNCLKTEILEKVVNHYIRLKLAHDMNIYLMRTMLPIGDNSIVLWSSESTTVHIMVHGKRTGDHKIPVHVFELIIKGRTDVLLDTTSD